MSMTLSHQQQQALEQLQAFSKREDSRCFVLTGYAGTGKTTLLGQYVKWLQDMDIDPVLLATTGRAARVLAHKTGMEATTVHSCVYEFDEVKERGMKASGQLQMFFGIRERPHTNSRFVYIVDEASMISSTATKQGHSAQFGSGHLLSDFLQFTQGHKVVFVGDPCQLPPVSEDTLSPALSPLYLQRKYGFGTDSFELTDIMRQGANSEILALAGPFREGIVRDSYVRWPKIGTPSGGEAKLHADEGELLNGYLPFVRKKRYEDAQMIVYSNAYCQHTNFNLRRELGFQEEPLEGELLQVVQNSHLVPFSNGDHVIIEQVEADKRKSGFQFLKMQLRKPGSMAIYETLVIKDLLYNEAPGLNDLESTRLLIDFEQRCRDKGIRRNSELFLKLMLTDPYLNALRVKFGYVITCHKAQGGEWPNLFLNISKNVYGQNDNARYRWFYTAITRASKSIHLNDGFWVEGYNQRQRQAFRPRY